MSPSSASPPEPAGGAEPPSFVLITGMSGAGRSHAANVLEDLGFFVIDNLPPSLIGKVTELARGKEGPERFAFVVDARAGAFVEDLGAAIRELQAIGSRTRVLFLDASDEVLLRRYDESRRRHPLSQQDVLEGIQLERAVLEEVKGQADLVLDTSEMNVHELRDRLVDLFGDADGGAELQTTISSFGFKHGTPVDLDLLFDVRFLPNPHWVEELRPLTGLDAPVRAYVLDQPETADFLAELERLLALLLPAYVREGKAYLSIGVGCTGGRHRSVVLASELGRIVERLGYPAAVHHRDVERGS